MQQFKTRWRRMMDRCYNPSFSTYKHYGAIGVTVCESWHTYSEFAQWASSQDHEGMELDKDILVAGCLTYSPATCRFVSGEVNRLLTARKASRGDLPLGVSRSSVSDKYRAQINKDGEKIHLGSRDTPEQAHALWQKAKADHIEEVALRQQLPEIRDSLLDRATTLRLDLLLTKQTHTL